MMKRRAAEGVCEMDIIHPSRVIAAKATLPPARVLRQAGDAFKTLGNPGRLRILKALDGRELCVCDMSQVLKLSMSRTSQHLRELRNLGAVEYRAEGKLAYYTLVDRFWLDLAEAVIGRIDGTQQITGRKAARA